MGLSYLLDTNTVIYMMQGRLADRLPTSDLYVSVVTEIELFALKEIPPDEVVSIREVLALVKVVDLTRALTPYVVDVRKQGLRLPDAIIAGTAAYLGAELLTHDQKLLKLPGLRCSAPPLL